MNIKTHENLLLRTFIMPGDLNALGTTFGGAILSYLDMAGAELAIRTTQSRVVLVNAKDTTFIHPVAGGDAIEIYGYVEKIGNTSLTVKMELWHNTPIKNQPSRKAGEGTFTYVAIDENLRPTPIKK
jgi:acyl-CoA thioesterase YciA